MNDDEYEPRFNTEGEGGELNTNRALFDDHSAHRHDNSCDSSDDELSGGHDQHESNSIDIRETLFQGSFMPAMCLVQRGIINPHTFIVDP